jgi:hypothetical protein
MKEETKITLVRAGMFLLFVGCLIAIPTLMGSYLKSADELMNQVSGEDNPVYGDTGVAIITIKDKVTLGSLFAQEIYLVDENNTLYACDTLEQYVNTSIGKQYQISWRYTIGYRVDNIVEVRP